MNISVFLIITVLVVLFALLVIGFVLSLRSGKVRRAAETERADLNEILTTERISRESAEKNLAKAETELETKRGEVVALSRDLASRESDLKNLNEKLAEQKGEVEKLNEKFSVEFKNLANEILEEKTKKFTTQNKENLDQVLNPLRDRILEFQKKVEDNHTAGEKRGAALHQQLNHLKEMNRQITKEAESLTKALRGESKTQGGWGEMQLETILEKVGLQKDVHYQKEQNLKTEEGGNQRLDFIINLPDGKHLILDSKVSLSAYANYFDTEDEAEQARFLKQHLASMHAHIKTLSGKNYQNLYNINAPDYVLMFIANEPALTMALKEDPTIYEKALDQNIVLVSTTTLLATLRTISYIWKQDQQNKNADEIARQAAALYDKFVGFTEDLIKLGNQLGTVQKTYQDSMKKLSSGRGNLVQKTEQLQKLGANPAKRIDQKLLDRSEKE